MRGGGDSNSVRDAERQRRMRQEVDTVRAKMNERAEEFAERLLPNGRASGHYWETSNIRDEKTGSYSLKVDLRSGAWADYGLARGQPNAGGDILSLFITREWDGNFAEGFAEARRLTGVDHMTDADFKRSAAESEKRRAEAAVRFDAQVQFKRGKAMELWKGSTAIAGAEGLTPGYQYLHGRAIDFAQLGRVPGSLRYHPAAWCREVAERDGKAHGKIPALIACVMGLDGQMRGVHRTYLDLSAGKAGPVTKAALEEPKLTLGPSVGGHIPLWKGEHSGPLHAIPPGTDVYMSEGIEDGLSIAIVRPQLRVIAGVSLGKMGEVELPPQIGRLVFIAQNDMKPEPIAQLHDAMEKQMARGFRVKPIYPPKQFKDFNDMLTGKVRK